LKNGDAVGIFRTPLLEIKDCLGAAVVNLDKDTKGSFFCNQECYKSNWDLHKNLHKLAKSDVASQSSKKGTGLFNPWPGYKFTGRLRPAAQSDKREVPANIRRPDYADHPEGYPLSEMKLKDIVEGLENATKGITVSQFSPNQVVFEGVKDTYSDVIEVR